MQARNPAVGKQREIFAKGVYNLKLGIKRVNGEEFNIVANDIDFDDESGRIYILTGPNREERPLSLKLSVLLFCLLKTVFTHLAVS